MKKYLKVFNLILVFTLLFLTNVVFAQNETIIIEYVNEEKNQNILETTNVDLEINCVDLIDKEGTRVSSWKADNIQGTYTDANGNEATATYEAAFAGWQLVSINGRQVTETYVYPDDDVVYFDDQPFLPYSGSITSLKFKALWGKVVYLRDVYNFKDITDVYGDYSADSQGDILTAKIDWDTSVEYSSDTNSGATQNKPVSTMNMAYKLLANSPGGRIVIVNHYTLQQPDKAYPWSPSYSNSNPSTTFSFGNGLNISGVVTLSGLGTGFGLGSEGKVEDMGSDYDNAWFYIHNERGCGLYNNKTYGTNYIYIRYYCHTVWQDFNMLVHRDTYNPIKAYAVNLLQVWNTANNRFLMEKTVHTYRRATTQGKNGKEITNWSTIAAHSISAITDGSYTGMYFYGSNSSYTKNGATYKVKNTDNVYLNLKGKGQLYIVYGMYATTGQKVNNVRFNFDDVAISGIRLFQGYDCTANLGTIRSKDFAGTMYVADTCDLNANDIKVNLMGTGKRTMTAFYGGGTYNSQTGGDVKKIVARQRYVINGQKISNFYGGGSQVTTLNKGEINIVVNSGDITALYGGGLGGFVGSEGDDTSINIEVNGGTISNVFGGGSGGQVTMYSTSGYWDLNSYNFVDGRYVYNNAKTTHRYRMPYSEYSPQATRWDNDMFMLIDYSVSDGEVSLGDYSAIRVNSLFPSLGTDANITRDLNYSYIYAVSDAKVNADVNITLNGGTISNHVYGGGRNGAVKGNIKIDVNDGITVKGHIYGGGQGLSDVIEGTLHGSSYFKINWTNSQEDYVFTPGRLTTLANQEGTAYKNAPEDANYPTFVLTKEMKNSYTHTDGKNYVYSNAIQKLGLIDGDTTINVYGSSLRDVFGGSRGVVASISGNSHINVYGGKIINVYGGGDNGVITDSFINIEGGTITGGVYGGGNLANINGNSNVNIKNVTIPRVLGGGYQGDVLGNATINSQRSTVTNLYGGGDNGHILGSTDVIINGGNITTLYGGGNNGDVTGDSNVTINLGTLDTVFGGGNLGVVEGNTNVTVGNSSNPYVTITSLLYGGGRGANSDFETVKGAATVLIEGLNTNVENYGSFKLGKVNGNVDVTFKDYWTGNATDKYKIMNGIDRATNVIFDNSFVMLSNIGDNGELVGIKDITNLYVEEGSGFKVSATSEIKGNFYGGGTLYLDSGTCLIVNKDIYGNTLLVLNPKIIDGLNMIIGTEAAPYILVKETDHSDNYTAVYGNDYRYSIVHDITNEGYGIYYIGNDVIIDDLFENTVINNRGSHYTDDASTWAKEDVYIRNNNVFSSNVSELVRFNITVGSTTSFNNIEREISLVSRDDVIAFPKGTIIKIYEDGNFYLYTVNANGMSAVRLSNFSNYSEKKNIMPYSTKIAENSIKHTETYEYAQNIRFIVDFSGVEKADLLDRGPYNFMVNYFNNNIPLVEMVSKAENVLRIEEARLYNVDESIDRDYYEGNSTINLDTTVTSEDDIISEDYYGNGLYGVISMRDSAGNNIPLDSNIKISINGNPISITNSNAKYMVLDNLTQTAIEKNNKISIDMSQIRENNRLKAGEYSIVTDYYCSDSSGNLLEKLFDHSTSFTIKEFSHYHIYATVTGDAEGTNLLKLSSSSPTRTVTIKYEGDLISPYIDIVVRKYLGNDNFANITNAFTQSKVEDLQLYNPTTFSYSSTNSGSRIRVDYILRNGNGEEKAREVLIFEFE